MAKPAFIVEGQTDKLFVASVCSDSPIRTLELNGRDVDLEAIIRRIETLSALLGGGILQSWFCSIEKKEELQQLKSLVL